jgi:CRP/FNR family transcriptional regulator, nitrogen oxide reductase regulator
VKNSTALLWRRDTLRQLANRHPKIWENAISIASDYFAWYLSAHLALITQDAHERLAEVVLSLSEAIGNGLELNVTNEELANITNISLFTVSRILSEWRSNGVLGKKRGKIVFFSRDRLRQFLEPHQRTLINAR